MSHSHPHPHTHTQRVDQGVVSDMDYLRSKIVPSTSQVDICSSVPDSDDEATPTKGTPPQTNTTPYTVKMLGLPFSVKEKGIREFFHPLSLAAVRLTTDSEGRPSGRAYVDLNSEADLKKALKRNKDCIGHRYIELFRDNGPQTSSGEQSTDPHRSWAGVSGVEGVEDVSESGRLFVRNLSYSTTEDDLAGLFDKFGPLTEVTIPLDKTTNRPTGFAFVTFMLPEHAVRAFEAIDGQIFQGRLIHLLPAKARESRAQKDLQGSSYKTDKLRKAKSESSKSHNWNTLFLGANAVVDAIADKYSVDKSEVLNSESSAVRLALGETQLVGETRAFMEGRGVQLEMFGNDKCKRSKTIILVKNLPYATTESELVQLFEPFGQLSQVILPPAGVSALVEFTEPVHARSAFQRLAYTSFKHLPLYLEWAPEAVIQHKKVEPQSEGVGPVAKETEIPVEQATVFVKNLSFSSSGSDLEEVMRRAGPVTSVSIARKKNVKDASKPLSMGYGFVEYSTHKAALRAIRRLQHTELGGHKLELKLSTRQAIVETSVRKTVQQTEQNSAKILVRNIPFEASKDEVRDLFQTFGTLKTVRLPKKLGASQSEHRGFGFVEYSTRENAKRAFDSLCQSTHLYGRRLVLEWAEQEETVEAIRKRTAEHFHVPSGKRSKVTQHTLLSSLERTVDE